MTSVGAFQSATGARGQDVPSPVRATIEKYFGSGGHDPDRVMADGVHLWVVSGTSEEGDPTTLTLSSAGDIQVIGTPIKFTALPTAVQAKLRAAYPKATFEQVESVQIKAFCVDVRGGSEPAQDLVICAAGNRLNMPVALTGSPEQGRPDRSGSQDD